MVELLVITGLLSPFVLMVWLTWARRRAQASVAARRAREVQVMPLATEDLVADGEGHMLGHRHMADHELAPPDASGGEPAGIRALQGRR